MRVFWAALIASVLAVAELTAETSLGRAATLAVDDEGWSVLAPSPDSRVIFVSNSMGDNANDGLSPQRPKQTLTAGMQLMRKGFPDHLPPAAIGPWGAWVWLPDPSANAADPGATCWRGSTADASGEHCLGHPFGPVAIAHFPMIYLHRWGRWAIDSELPDEAGVWLYLPR